VSASNANQRREGMPNIQYAVLPLLRPSGGASPLTRRGVGLADRAGGELGDACLQALHFPFPALLNEIQPLLALDAPQRSGHAALALLELRQRPGRDDGRGR
jgi:hypothetical protein